MKKFLNPLFLFGLLIRLALVFTVLPLPLTEWYLPFLSSSIDFFSFDPWKVWLNQGGSIIAFPYGYAMWLFFLPLMLVFKTLGLSLIYGYGSTLILADFSLLLVIQKIIPNRERLLLAVYWLSPIVIFASYLLGFNDLIPTLFLTTALYCIKKSKLLLSGFFCLMAISAKLSMVLALPFFAIYLLRNRNLRQFSFQFAIGTLIGAAIAFLPFFLLSNSGLNMIFSNPEIEKIYLLHITIGSSMKIYLILLIYLLTIYAAWKIRRMNFELFHAVLGIAFLLVILATPASPGWFIWAMPLLASYQAANDRFAVTLTTLFSILYTLNSILISHPEWQFISQLLTQMPLQLNNKLTFLLNTMLVGFGIILIVRIWQDSVSQNNYFRLSQKPFVLGIAGDSGSGKDNLCDAIKGLFGNHSVATLSGDDYHLWDRQKPIWQVMTHLNPMANDLERFSNDLIFLVDGKKIQSRHYDHNTGFISLPFSTKSNDIIIASGLHALYLPILRQCYNLSIYLDIDEDLRRYFKIKRDVNVRGHSIEKVMSSFEKREPDSARFIRPQKYQADLVLSLQPIHPNILKDINSQNSPRFKLLVNSRNRLNEMSLKRVLIGVCGLQVDMLNGDNDFEVALAIEGETSAQDIAMAAQIICPRILEFLDINPKWQDGVMGIMQLITLSHINQALTKRFI